MVFFFEKFLQAMGGFEPQCIIANYVPIINIAIGPIFNTCGLFLCLAYYNKGS